VGDAVNVFVDVSVGDTLFVTVGDAVNVFVDISVGDAL
jgi:hypothetical protein